MPPEQRGPGQWRVRSAQKPAHSGRRSSLQASVPSHGANPGDVEECGPSLKSAFAVGRLHGDSHVPNRTGEIPPSGMKWGDAGNGPRRGMRHRRIPMRSRLQLLPAAHWHCACVLSRPQCGNSARWDPWRGLRVTVIPTPTWRDDIPSEELPNDIFMEHRQRHVFLLTSPALLADIAGLLEPGIPATRQSSGHSAVRTPRPRPLRQKPRRVYIAEFRTEGYG